MRGAGAAGWVGRTIAGPGKGLRAPVRPRVGLQQCPSDPGFNRRPRLQRCRLPCRARALPTPSAASGSSSRCGRRRPADSHGGRRAGTTQAGLAPPNYYYRWLGRPPGACAAGVSGSGGGLSLPGKTPRPHLPVRPWAVAPLNLLQSSRREIFFFYPSAPSSADANTQPPIYRCAYGTWCVWVLSTNSTCIFFPITICG